MSCIGFPRKADPELHDYYAKKLLIPGWAGQLTDAEASYIAEKLRDSVTLRRAWAVRNFTRYRKHITPAIVKRMAAAWATNPVLGAKVLSTASDNKGKEQTMTESSGGTQLELIGKGF